MIDRRQALATLAGGALAAPQAVSQQRRKPNVIVILADDLGFGEVLGGAAVSIPTPNVESIARQGVRFENGYVSCPVCAPTRAGLLTGRYQQRFGFEFNPGPVGQEEDQFGLPREEPTLAERMKALGYRTGMVGKWHLGLRPGFRPLDRGFEDFFGFLAGAHSYVSNQPRNPIYRGAEPVEEKEYLTDAFSREAVRFIESNKSSPFFLYLAFNAVHAPMEAIERYTAKFDIGDRNRRTFAGMLAAMDAGIGRVLESLRRHQLERDTLVLFLSDNGGPTPQTTATNAPYRGLKGQVLEGGIHVPFAMKWPGRIAAGSTFDSPVISLDIHSTALRAAGGAPPKEKPLDGVDLLPFVSGAAKGAPHDALYWRFGEQRAIRHGDWKLLSLGGPGAAWELYNLKTDVSERNNLASAQPELVQQLRARFETWNAQMQPPAWTRGGGARREAERP